MWEKLKDHLVDDIHCMWRWWTTWLNMIGSAIVTYALAHEAVVNTLLPFLPAPLKPYAPLIGVAWGVLVQGLRSWKQKLP